MESSNYSTICTVLYQLERGWIELGGGGRDGWEGSGWGSRAVLRNFVFLFEKTNHFFFFGNSFQITIATDL